MNETGGHWATDGCRTEGYAQDNTAVNCACDHFTNFALLVNPSNTSRAPVRPTGRGPARSAYNCRWCKDDYETNKQWRGEINKVRDRIDNVAVSLTMIIHTHFYMY